MDLVACRIFLELAEVRHFARTAAHCNLSPSAVSRHLQRLEQRVGHKLVERDNRRVRLTPAGHRFLDYARQSVDAWHALRTELGAAEDLPRGEVSVFGSVTASYSLLTRILPAMRANYPGVELKLRTGDQADGIRRVLEGLEDSAIVAKPDPLSRRLAFLPLRQTPLVLIGPRTPSALTRQLDLCLGDGGEPDWNQLPMVLAERGLARERLLKRLQGREQRPNIYAQVAGHEAVVSMVSLGFGVAIVPELVLEHSPVKHTVRVLPWLADLPPFELGLCAVDSRVSDALLRAFWSCAEASYPQVA